MSGVKISALPAATSAQLTDVFPIDQLPGPVTYKLASSQLLSLFQTQIALNGQPLTSFNDTNVTMTLGGSPTIALLNATSITLGWTGALSGTRGGTGVNNGASTITLGGSLTTSGAFATTFTMTGPTNVTFPTSGTLSTTTGTVTSVSGTINRITSTGGATPVIDISASYVGQSSITTLGTIGTGVWQGTVIGATYGGTGINNGASTITLGGSLTTSGSFASTFTMTGATNVTFPTSGTLATTAGTVSSVTGTANRITSTGGNTPVIDISASYVGQSSITTLGTIATGTWQSTVIGSTYGGTGVNNGANTITLGGNVLTAGALTLAGAFPATFNFSASTNVTFPISGTLSTTTGTVTSVSGTTNRITSTGGATPVIDISASYVGQTSITTLGTITTGVWTGTTIAIANGGTGITSFGTGVQTALGQNVTGSGGIVLATSPTITTPKIAQINDANGNGILFMIPVASAVNYIYINNSITGSKPTIGSAGSDTNVGLTFNSQGTGAFQFFSAATTNQILVGTGAAYQHSTALSFPSTAASQTYIFPDASGTVGLTSTGTWTPIDASGAALTFSTATGTYIQIGNVVIATAYVVYPSTVSGAAAIIGGLPIVTGSTNQKMGGHVAQTTVATLAHALTLTSNTAFSLYTTAGAGVLNSAMTGSTNTFQVIYFT